MHDYPLRHYNRQSNTLLANYVNRRKRNEQTLERTKTKSIFGENVRRSHTNESFNQ